MGLSLRKSFIERILFILKSILFIFFLYLFLVIIYYRTGVEIILCVLPFIGSLLGVAFYTLLERKILAYIQRRQGPAKVGFIGLLQPFRDAIKLFTKEIIIPTYASQWLFKFCPFLVLSSRLITWVLYPCEYLNTMFICGVIQFLATCGWKVYGVILAGWSSNSKYALLGCVRAIAQTISYEIPIRITRIVLIFVIGSLWVEELEAFQRFLFRFLFISLISAEIWLICILAECQRSPFDFVEGESELVSGFNVEYRRGGFGIIFIAEYSSILFRCIYTAAIFFGGSLGEFLVTNFLLLIFIWARGTVPRMRYDKLMSICWGRILVMSIVILTLLVLLAFIV